SDSYVLNPDAAFWEGIFKERALLEKVGEFFANESAVAVLRAGGSSGILHDDTGYSLGWFVYRPEHRQAIPSAVIADEAFDRMSRLLTHNVPVTVRLNVKSRFTGDHQPGINVIAEIPGTDRTLKDQIVMLGGHLDSWTAGTGATDDGAGVIIGLEAIRILRALDIHSRRTIRLALWGGYSMKPDEQTMPNFVRQQIGPISVRADYAALDAYFNTDNGTGKFLGIFTEGNTAVANVFQRWLPLVQDLGFTTISLRNSGATDHTSFDRIGLDGFQFLQDPRDYDSRTGHTNLDTYEHLSEVDLKQAAVVMAIFVFNTAQRVAMLPRKPMPHPEQNEKRDMPLEGIYPRLAP
ncbi:MAG: M28 family peptidase, partial [Acidobacteriales bacterium]|nr:M28 family peptidase [Terriglobales bacterium]